MNPRVYFYCVDRADAYQDDVVVLADGLRQIGVQVSGNCNYWQQSIEPDDWLIQTTSSADPDDADVVVVSSAWSRWIDDDFKIHERPLPEKLFAPGRCYRTAYVDYDDGYATSTWRPEYRPFDAIFRAKYNRRCFHPDNQHPWVLGLNSRMLAMTAGSPPWSERKREVLINFGASHPYAHTARTTAAPPFMAAAQGVFSLNEQRDDLSVPPTDPYDLLMWRQTQHRHSRAYYERLKSAQAIAAFCGDIIPPAPFYPRYLVGGGRARLSRRWYEALAKIDSRPSRLIQWDSWRFWEGLAAGCLVFNLDLAHYGVQLPVMPQHLEHYVAIRPENAAEVFATLARSPGLAEKIASQGRTWALEHYSPAALARRFLDTMLGGTSSGQ